jgi:hypothetical protein
VTSRPGADLDDLADIDEGFRRARWVVPVAAGLAALPVVWATARALVRGWMPMGDNAWFTVRSRDVLTEHHPLLGAWSSGSASVGELVNNLGPLQLDLLAVPVRVDWAAGTAIGTGLVNVGAALVAVVAGRRAGGPLGAALVAVLVAGVAWSMGSELLFEPRQHHALVLPFLCVLVVSWALAAGWAWALPWLVGWSSLVAQTHLTFVVPVLAASVWALVAWWARAGVLRRTGWHRPPDVRVLWVGACVAVLAWIQPLIDQIWAPMGEGNVSSLLAAAGGDQATAGPGHGARAVATVVSAPPWWGRPGFRDFEPAAGLLGPVATVVGLGAVGAVLASVVALGHRRRRWPLVALGGTGAVSVAAAWVQASTTPVEGSFGAVAGNYRWLWPVAALVTLTALVGLVEVLRGLEAKRRLVARDAVSCALVVAALLAGLALPTAYGSPGPEADAPLIPAARDLVDQLGDLDGEHQVLVERGGLWFGEPFTYVLLAALQDRGIDLRFTDPVDERRFGPGRVHEGGDIARVRLVGGDAALADPPPDEERLALVTGLDAPQEAVAVLYRSAGGRAAPSDPSGDAVRRPGRHEASSTRVGATSSARTGW